MYKPALVIQRVLRPNTRVSGTAPGAVENHQWITTIISKISAFAFDGLQSRVHANDCSRKCTANVGQVSTRISHRPTVNENPYSSQAVGPPVIKMTFTAA